MDGSRPTIVDFLDYLSTLDERRHKAADVLHFKYDAAEWLDRAIVAGRNVAACCADFPTYVAAKCSLRDLQLGDDVEPELSGRVFLSGPLLARCALRKQAACGLSWALVFESEAFEFVDGTTQTLRHVPALNEGTIVAAWAMGRNPGHASDRVYVAYPDQQIPVDDSGTLILECAVRGMLERVTGSLPVARALRLNVDYLGGLDQVHEYLFPAFPNFADAQAPCPACDDPGAALAELGV